MVPSLLLVWCAAVTVCVVTADTGRLAPVQLQHRHQQQQQQQQQQQRRRRRAVVARDALLRPAVPGVSTVAAGQRPVVPTQPPLRRSTARLLLAMCAALYGSTYPLTKQLQEAMIPSMVTTLRFALAVLFFLPQMKRVFGDPALLLSTLELGLWSAMGFISQAKVLSKTSASKAAFFGGLSVIMPPLFELVAAIVQKVQALAGRTPARPRPTAAAAAAPGPQLSLLGRAVRLPVITPALALCGAAWLACGGFTCTGLGWDDLRLLITPASFAMCFWRAADVGARFPDDATAITAGMLMTMTAVCAGWAATDIAALCAPTSGAVGAGTGMVRCALEQLGRVAAAINPATSVQGPRVLLGLLYTGVCATAVTSATEQQAIRVVSAAEVRVVAHGEPQSLHTPRQHPAPAPSCCPGHRDLRTGAAVCHGPRVGRHRRGNHSQHARWRRVHRARLRLGQRCGPRQVKELGLVPTDLPSLEKTSTACFAVVNGSSGHR